VKCIKLDRPRKNITEFWHWNLV